MKDKHVLYEEIPSCSLLNLWNTTIKFTMDQALQTLQIKYSSLWFRFGSNKA